MKIKNISKTKYQKVAEILEKQGHITDKQSAEIFGKKKDSIPDWLYKALKDAEPLDCWTAYDEVWNKVKDKLEEVQKETVKECMKVFEQKMNNLNVKWGRVHKADCVCEDCDPNIYKQITGEDYE